MQFMGLLDMMTVFICLEGYEYRKGIQMVLLYNLLTPSLWE